MKFSREFKNFFFVFDISASAYSYDILKFSRFFSLDILIEFILIKRKACNQLRQGLLCVGLGGFTIVVTIVVPTMVGTFDSVWKYAVEFKQQTRHTS